MCVSVNFPLSHNSCLKVASFKDNEFWCFAWKPQGGSVVLWMALSPLLLKEMTNNHHMNNANFWILKSWSVEYIGICYKFI